MINKVNSSPSFNGVASYYVAGKKVLSQVTTKEQDTALKAVVDCISSRGRLNVNVSDDVAKFFHKYIEKNVFKTKLAFGDQKKAISNIVGPSVSKNFKEYISFGDTHPELPKGTNFNIIF